MKIIVTGAAGFLGSHICKVLIDHGHQVTGISYPGEKRTHLEHLPVLWAEADITDINSLNKSFEGQEALIHSAGNCSFYQNDKDKQWKVNVIGTQNVLNMARKFKLQKIVHISTINALGYPLSNELGNESTSYNWFKEDIGYFKSKKAAQDLAIQASNQGMNVSIVNPATMFGPNDINFNAASYIKGLLKAPGFMICPSGGTTIADVEKVAYGVYQAMLFGKNGECYIMGGESVTYRELFKLISKILHRPILVIPLPTAFFIVIGKIFDWASKFVSFRFPLTEDMAKASARKLFYSSEKAVKDLNYKENAATEAIYKAVDWYKKLPSRTF